MTEGKTDITDFFTTLGKNKADFDLLLQCAAKYIPEPEEKERVSIADELLEITRGAGVKAISDQRGEACLIYPDEPFAAYPLKGSGKYRSWIIGRYYELTGSGVSGNTLKDVIDTIEAQASYENSKITLWDRVGKDDKAIYYDLGNGRQIVKIDDKNWDIYTRAPICFRRNKLQVEQVLPSKDGNLRELLKFVNIRNEENQILFLTYLVAGLRPATPRPLLLIYGDQGSAKSTNLRMVRCLIDPSSAGYHPSKSGNLLSPPKDLEDLAGKTVFNYGLFFDNLSYCPGWLSDALCRLITGSTYSKRMLYENFNEVVVDAMPLVAITGINQIADKSDLIDRTLLIEMERIPDNKRKEESELWRDFQTALPNILGGLFNTLSKTLSIYPSLQMKELPRMADFGKFAAASAIALGYPLEKFVEAYKANVKSQNSNAIDSSPVAQMIINFVEQDMITSPCYDQKNEVWRGTKAELYLILRQKAELQKIPIGGHIGFPSDATWLWRKIKEVRPNLQALNIFIEENRTESKRSIILSRKPILPSQFQAELPLTANPQNKDDNGILDEFKNEEGGQEA